jgi:mannose-1-phosphate guanylyltransferase
VTDLDVEWLDVGSWPALARTLDVDPEGNAVRGPVVVVDGAGNVVFNDDPEHVVATVGLQECVVVHTRDVTLVCPIADAERVKVLLEAVKARFPGRLE